MNKQTVLISISVIGLSIATSFVMYRRINAKRKLKRRINQQNITDNGDINYKEIGKNIGYGMSSKREELYKRLIIQIHPDRFTDDRKVTATELSQRITEAKHNYSELVEIEKEVSEFIKL